MPTVSRPRRRREILSVVLLLVVFAVGGFLIGYFAMKAGSKDAAECQNDNGTPTPEPAPAPNKEKYHNLFQEEINAKNIEENLK